jgi:hypothetical protein
MQGTDVVNRLLRKMLMRLLRMQWWHQEEALWMQTAGIVTAVRQDTLHRVKVLYYAQNLPILKRLCLARRMCFCKRMVKV